jgi:hypothetical protein
MNCPLCLREDIRFENHHLQTKRKDKSDTEKICIECHKTIYGLFTHQQLRDDHLGLDVIEGLLENETFAKALTFIKKVPPGAYMPMRQAKTKRKKR